MVPTRYHPVVAGGVSSFQVSRCQSMGDQRHPGIQLPYALQREQHRNNTV
ncbi:MAG TPA: hypothetical protein VGL77_21140 [Armatimonadota bacterium]